MDADSETGDVYFSADAVADLSVKVVVQRNNFYSDALFRVLDTELASGNDTLLVELEEGESVILATITTPGSGITMLESGGDVGTIYFTAPVTFDVVVKVLIQLP